MLNREKHQLIMTKILKDIYTDVEISSLLGFKGGTCVYYFYKLSRFSVDLDFDLQKVSEENKKVVYEKILSILAKYGKVKDRHLKKYTIFALLSYGDGDHNIKIEINTRELHENICDYYEVKDYLGISMLIAKKDYMFASKLAALTSRREIAMRDVYDIYFFANLNWDINSKIIKDRTGKSIKDYLSDCISCIEKIKDNQVLRGLGELVGGEKEKNWIRDHLRSECIFMLNNYRSVIK